jgi:hypothetical protein
MAASVVPAKEAVRIRPDTCEHLQMAAVENTATVHVAQPEVEAGLAKSGVIICDHRGQRAELVDGHVKVVSASGLPLHGYDASTAADTWQTIMAVNRECHYAYLIVQTNDAIVSFDGGASEHMYLTKTIPVGPLEGLKIPAGATIVARNATAGQNYTLLHVFVW